jgi:hypothetical protein
MKVQVFSVALLATAVYAQLPASPVEKNNDPWLVISATKHPTTGQPYNWPPVSPAGFAPGGGGVANGTRTVRWIPSETNLRREVQNVSSVFIGLRPSAASVSFPQTGYFPEVNIHPARQLAAGATWMQGRQMSADFTAAPTLVVAQSTHTFANYGNFLVTRNLTTSIPLNAEDVVLSAKWDANGQATPINDDNPAHQSFFGSFSDGVHTTTTVQFAAPAPANTLTPYNDGNSNFSVTWFSYGIEQSALNQQSDWGYRRDARLPPAVSGYSVGTAWADLALVPGQLGWDIEAAGKAGHVAVPVMNVGPVFPAFLDFLGLRFEVNLGDPLLSLLIGANYIVTIDPQNFGNGALVPLPALGAPAIGTTIGV